MPVEFHADACPLCIDRTPCDSQRCRAAAGSCSRATLGRYIQITNSLEKPDRHALDHGAKATTAAPRSVPPLHRRSSSVAADGFRGLRDRADQEAARDRLQGPLRRGWLEWRPVEHGESGSAQLCRAAKAPPNRARDAICAALALPAQILSAARDGRCAPGMAEAGAEWVQRPETKRIALTMWCRARRGFFRLARRASWTTSAAGS